MAWHFLDVTWWVTSKCNHIWQVQLLFLWFPAREVVRHKLSLSFDFHWTAVNKIETFIFQDLICLFCHLKKGMHANVTTVPGIKRQNFIIINANLHITGFSGTFHSTRDIHRVTPDVIVWFFGANYSCYHRPLTDSWETKHILCITTRRRKTLGMFPKYPL